MDRPSTFGLWLRQRRKAGDLTQEQLAAEVGCAAETIRKIEADARRPSRAMLDRIAQVLAVPIAERAELLRWARNAVAAPAVAPPAPPRGQRPLLTTKLYAPRSRARSVGRPRLLRQLDAGSAGRLTVVVAPPGFGKTTLLAEWLHQWSVASDQRSGATPTDHRSLIPGHSSAWLTLDAADAEQALFLRYLIAALQTVAPAFGAVALRLVEAGDAGHVAAALPLLANDLALLPERTALVLDDFHAADTPAVREAVSFLLDHLPPHVHLVVAGRSDPALPLARLRVRGELAEVRAADLRFTPDEAAHFLREVMGVPVSAADVATLERRTEGWIAGLQLAALSLQGQSQPHIADFIAAFGGSHHYVVDFLLDEVLTRQPPQLQTFLLQTSLLERLCGPLCDAVMDQPAGSAEQVLLELERRQLFLVPLDDARRWYRYHQLFGDTLRFRLERAAPPAELATLHRRAAQWLMEQGSAAEALEHALAAQDWPLAAGLVERAGARLALGNLQQYTQLQRWMDALPDAVVHSRPQLCLLRARHFMLTDLAQTRAWIELAEQALPASAPAQVTANMQGELAALRAGVAASQGAAVEAIGHAHAALAALDAENTAVRAEVMQSLARAHLSRHAAADAAAALTQMAALARASGDPLATFVSAANLVYVQRLQGASAAALQTCRRTLADAAHHGVEAAPDASWILASQADLLREGNDLDAALSLAEDATARSRQLRFPNLALLGAIVLARAHQARGDSAAALHQLAAIRASAEQFRVVPVQQIVDAFEAQLYLQQGNAAAARGLLSRADDPPTLEPFWISPLLTVYGYEHLAVAPAQTLLAEGRASGERHLLLDARSRLQALQAQAEREALPWLRVKALTLLALVAQELDDSAVALTTLDQALTLASALGYVRVFLDEGAPLTALLRRSVTRRALPERIRAFGRQLLGAAEPTMTGMVPTPNRAAASTAVLVEPLTAREQEVLHQLGAGRSNQAIAAELVVAVDTVKHHIASILAKLAVDSRLAAVARARELGLL